MNYIPLQCAWLW